MSSNLLLEAKLFPLRFYKNREKTYPFVFQKAKRDLSLGMAMGPDSYSREKKRPKASPADTCPETNRNGAIFQELKPGARLALQWRASPEWEWDWAGHAGVLLSEEWDGEPRRETVVWAVCYVFCPYHPCHSNKKGTSYPALPDRAEFHPSFHSSSYNSSTTQLHRIFLCFPGRTGAKQAIHLLIGGSYSHYQQIHISLLCVF